LGSALITHPFHRHHGQRFDVLKVRRLTGGDSLSLRHPELGTFAVSRDWTDWSPPGSEPPPGAMPLFVDALALLQLAELVKAIKSEKGVDA
jgi:hypothetical protein